MKTLERLNSDWMLATEINKLQARLWRMVKKDGIKVVLVTSAVRGEGKSTTVAYLATAMGQYPDRKILAVDLDFRRPALGSYFGISEYNLGEVLRGTYEQEKAILKTTLPSLEVALPNPTGDDPGLLLNTPMLHGLFQRFRERYDLILMDVPALIPVADASLLIPLADGVILATMAGKTTKPQLSRARALCQGLGASILGLVVGNFQEAVPDYESYGYYSYGSSTEDQNNGKPDARRGGHASAQK